VARRKHAHLLATLLLSGDAPVSSERLIDELWQGRPPASAHGNLKTYVWALRGLLSTMYGPGPVPLVNVRGGYRLELAEDELDAAVFHRLVEQGRASLRAGHAGAAEAAFTEALALWRGDALHDLPDTGELRAARQRLREQRLVAVEDLTDLRINDGRQAEVIGQLRTQVGADPLRERPWAQLMTALSRDGRRGEALEAYRLLRRTLVDELGVEPSAPLQELHQHVLNGDPIPPTGPTRGADPPATPVPTEPIRAAYTVPAPRQLPRDVATFVGRKAELDRLAGLLAAEHDGPGPVVVVHGPPGCGKSALAVRAANAAGSQYPDGHLYANLRGATPGHEPLSPAGCLGMFLRALGVAPATVPADVDEAAALFRTLVSGRRFLVVLDDAASAAQVRPLLPGGAGTAVLVTSRVGLAALDGASDLNLGPLDPDEADAMLERLLDDGRTGREPDATRRLAELCNRLPLGLHLAAARLRARPGWPIQWFVDRLAYEQDRLTELTIGDVGVRASLMVSHAALNRSDDPRDRAAAKAFCLLGLVQVSEIEVGLAAALCETAVADALTLIERLADAHLIEPAAVGRYRMHDLVRLFAQERSAEETPAERPGAALSRALGYYLATAVRAGSLAYPHRLHFPTEPATVAAGELTGPDEARAWLDRERANLVAVSWQALRSPDEDHRGLGINLVKALHWHLVHGCHAADAVGLNEYVLRLAEASGDIGSAACAHGSLAFYRGLAGDWDGATAHNRRQLELSRQAGDRVGEVLALGNLSLVEVQQDRPRQAMSWLRRQLDTAREIGANAIEAFALGNLGRIQWKLGQYAEATSCLDRSRDRYRAVGDDYGLCWVLMTLGQIAMELGDLPTAIATLTDSIHHARRIGNRLEECWILIHLAQATRAAGATADARAHATVAIELAAEIGDGDAEAAARLEHERAAGP
jgi:DNA-binding SARP family transcriptional activator